MKLRFCAEGMGRKLVSGRERQELPVTPGGRASPEMEPESRNLMGSNYQSNYDSKRVPQLVQIGNQGAQPGLGIHRCPLTRRQRETGHRMEAISIPVI
jgi:hypothetical protein